MKDFRSFSKIALSVYFEYLDKKYDLKKSSKELISLIASALDDKDAYIVKILNGESFFSMKKLEALIKLHPDLLPLAKNHYIEEWDLHGIPEGGCTLYDFLIKQKQKLPVNSDDDDANYEKILLKLTDQEMELLSVYYRSEKLENKFAGFIIADFSTACKFDMVGEIENQNDVGVKWISNLSKLDQVSREALPSFMGKLKKAFRV